MDLPVNERRFFIGMLTKEASEREERNEQLREKQTNSNARGSRSSRVSGNALKSKMKSGQIPLT